MLHHGGERVPTDRTGGPLDDPVCAAPPGIRTFLDLPTIMGRHTLGPVKAGNG
jgi:hypothetical protein